MSTAYRPNRKATDQDIIKLNSLGISLRTIGRMLDVHPTSITLRLRSLGIPTSDTRRSFMEGVLDTLSEDQKEWLADQLGPRVSIKDYVRNLLVKEYLDKAA